MSVLRPWERRGGLPLAFGLAALGLLLSTGTAQAQISLSTAVNLALQNSPRVRIAQSDVDRARAVLSETKDFYIPSVAANAGVGKEVGAPLSPPVVFSIAAQSLVFNFSQPDYIRAARAGLHSAALALSVARTDVSEDAINTYLALDNAQGRRRVQTDALTLADRLVEIVGDRFAAGVDPHIEVTRAKRTAAQIRLQELQVEDEISSNQEHLAALTGLTASGWQTVPDSIPAMHLPAPPSVSAPNDPNKLQGISAAFASARAKQYTARGDRRSLGRPTLSFAANYSRLEDAFTSYDLYYPSFPGTVQHPNSFNSLSAGIQLSLPIVDMVRRAKARESEADAAHALFDAQVQQANFLESRVKLRHSAAELAVRAEVMALDHDLAQDDLDAVMLRLRAVTGTGGGPQASPKDEENARLAERQRTIDMLSVELQLHQTEVTLMRQEGSLTDYLAAIIPGATATPAAATPDTRPPLAPTLGATPAGAPAGAPAGGSAPAPVPTPGATPTTLPSAPVSTPSTSSPQSTPQPGAPVTPHP